MKRGAIALPLAALAVAGGVIGVNFASGGADYEPKPRADPCAASARGVIPPDIEALAERVVLTGLQITACRFDVTRERLILSLPLRSDRRELARSAGTTEAGLARAIKIDLVRAVEALDRRRELPKASKLLPSILDEADLPGLAQDIIRRLPGGVVDDLLPTAGVLRRSIQNIDTAKVLEDIEDPSSLEPLLRDAVVDGARDAAKDRLIDKVPDPIRSILGLD